MKKTLLIVEESIASSIKDFSKGTMEVEKMKMQMIVEITINVIEHKAP